MIKQGKIIAKDSPVGLMVKRVDECYRLNNEGRRGASLRVILLMIALYDHESLGAAYIATELGISLGGVTHLVQGAVEAGLVRQWTDPNDGRVRNTELTPRGRQIVIDGINPVAALVNG